MNHIHLLKEKYQFSIIVAVDENNGIGKDNDLLVKISEDLKRFKELTTGKTVIMGYKTFKSLPFENGLPNRRNIVLTRSKRESKTDSVVFVNDISDVFKLVGKKEEAFIIGGSSIYSKFIHIANKIYLTKIHNSFPADTFFPIINRRDWEVESESNVFKDSNSIKYSFINYTRKRSVIINI